ncbi:MAG: hypothetical protein PWP23_2439 [Candidatus Sumerlaeota bacterium]|nr:hypothetical protein [Candidatus Sumerlaeota bacterium]
MKKLLPVPFSPLLLACLLAVRGAWAVGDAATNFQIFVPPNNDVVHRDSALIVTNVSPNPAAVTIEDTGEDGDTDDSVSGLVLVRGQSHIVFIKDGAVNDDAGSKWDGDYFRITSDQPVVTQIATRSDWQWDFVPADNRTMRGQSFFIYSPSTSVSDRDLNVFAYEPGTEVSLLRISTTPLNATGTTAVNLEDSVEIFKVTLEEGEDLIVKKGLGVDVLDPGHSYWVRSTRSVTVMSGSLVGNARDGMAFVPSRNGSSTGELFYFMIPADYGGERELRLIAYEDGTVATFEGWDEDAQEWVTVTTFQVDAGGHGDWVEGSTRHRLYRLATNADHPVSVLIQDWMEANGISGTKDDTSFGSSSSGYGAGRDFLMYLPPPGNQYNVTGFRSQESHVFLYGHVNGTLWSVTDADTDGTLINRTGTLGKGEFARISVNSTVYNGQLNKPANGIRPYVRISADHLITAQVSNFNDNWMTYVPSVTLPNPNLTASSLTEVVGIGDTHAFTFSSDNIGASALLNAEIRLILDGATTYTGTVFTGFSPGSPTVTTDAETGRQNVVWQDLTIPEGAEFSAQVEYEVNPRRPDNSRVLNGDFVLQTVQIRGEGYGTPAATGGESETFTAQASAAAQVRDTNQTVVNFFAAQASGNSVTASWQTAQEPDATQFRVHKSNKADGTFTLLSEGTVDPKGDALTGADYSVVDSGLSGIATLFYRLEVIDVEGNTTRYGPVSVSYRDTIPPAKPVITSASPSDSRVDLHFAGGDEAGDLKGYDLFRADTQGGTYTKVGGTFADPTGSDSTARNGSTLYYRVQAVDTAGNRSELSDPVAATLPTSLSTGTTLAYEDQLGPDANDWDYNDFVVLLRVYESFAPAGLSDVVIEVEPAARGASFSNQFWLRMSVAGDWSATIERFNDRTEAGLLSSDVVTGSSTLNLKLWEDTREALPPAPEDFTTNTRTSQTTPIYGEFVRVTITLDNPALNPSASRHRAPFDPYLKSELGEIHLLREGFPDSTEIVGQDGPLQGLNLEYVLEVPNPMWLWPRETRRIWVSYPEMFAAYLLSGANEATDWNDSSNADPAHVWANYSFLDLGTKETVKSSTRRETMAKAVSPSLHLVSTAPAGIVAPLNLWTQEAGPFQIPVGIVGGTLGETFTVDGTDTFDLLGGISPRARPVRAVLVPDGDERLLEGDSLAEDTNSVRLRDAATGTLLWENSVDGAIKSPLVLADVTGDDSREILFTTDAGTLHVWNAAGTRVFAPVSLGTQLLERKNVLLSPAPLVADINGDGTRDILTASASNHVHAVDAAGGSLAGWPRLVDGAVTASPVLARDPDTGEARVLVVTRSGTLYCFDGAGRQAEGYPIALGHAVIASPAVFTTAQLSEPLIVLAAIDGTVSVLSLSGDELPGWPVSMEQTISASPVVADLDGDAQPDVIVASEGGTVAAWSIDGTPLADFPLETNGIIQSTPAVTDFGFDGRPEVWVATADGRLLRWTAAESSALSLAELAPWPCMLGGARGDQWAAETFTAVEPSLAIGDQWMFR